MTLHEPVALALTTVLTVVRSRQAEPHPVLAGTPTWYDDSALRALDEHARDELARHFLVSSGRTTPEFDDLIDVLVRPDRELYGWIDAVLDGRPRRYGVLAVAGYRVGLLVVRDLDTDVVVMRSARPSRLVEEFVGQLPDVPAGVGEAVSMPYDDFLVATTERDEFVGFHVQRDPRVAALRELLAEPRTGAGNLYTATRSDHNARRRNEHPVNYIDTPSGRWLTTLRSDGEQLIATARPATRHTIARALELRSTLA